MSDTKSNQKSNQSTANASATYESSDITAMSDLQSIRHRSGMYVGDTTDPRQLIVEANDNGNDEELAGFSTKSVITVDTEKNLYSVRDYGRGIPIGKSKYVDSVSGETHEIESIQLVYTKVHAGAKLGTSASYKISRGMHGVGGCCICALSSHMKAVTYRDGKSVTLITSQGNIVSLDYSDTTEPNGVYLEFIPDPSMFVSPVIPRDALINICAIPKAFGLHEELFIDGIQIDLPYKDIFDLIPTYNDENELLRVKLDPLSNQSMTVALKYTSDTNTIYRGYTNMISNPGGGSHLRFFENAYKSAWEKYLDPGFKIQDVLIGLRALIEVSIPNDAIAFASQTKERLTTPIAYFDQYKTELISKIQAYFDSHDTERNGLIKRFKEYRAAQNKLLSSKELSSLIYINDNTSGVGIRRKSVVDKLRECTSKDRKGTRLIIVEGDSAGGSYIQCRDVKYHAILPLRGKVLNVSKYTDYVQCMKNAEIQSIVNSAGTGIGDDCDASKSRYEMYCISTDSDSDGLNIASLVTAIFVNLLPDVVKAGMLYIVLAPLYGWTDSSGRHYSNNLNDVTNLNTLTRYKGLGEMDPDELRETCIDKPTLLRVEYPADVAEFNKVMTSSSVRFQLLCDRGLVTEK